MSTPTMLGPGERAPDFVLPTPDGTLTRFYARAGGRPVLLLFSDARDEWPACLEHLRHRADVFLVLDGPCTPSIAAREIFLDRNHQTRRAYRLDETADATVFVLDPNLRVLDGLLANKPDAAARIQAVLAELPEADPVEIVIQAPVLLIPNVLAPEICRTLIGIWDTRKPVWSSHRTVGGKKPSTVNKKNAVTT